ncbi:MAG TPA: thioredoxin domain-containing protein [Nitrososphaeraceae archaeon]|nr:thioredoxin domain-containing protein [Nitrososphaeraceae archaeon]
MNTLRKKKDIKKSNYFSNSNLKIFLLFLFGIGISTIFFQFNYPIFVSAQELNNNELSRENLLKNISPVLGNPDAPITILDFSDFQCPNCGRYVKNTEPLINETYIQTGKVSLVYKYFPVVGFDSINAALGGQCAQEQGKFWEFHELLFANQKSIDSGWVSKDNLKNFAAQISGLDIQKFAECLDDELYIDHINLDLEMAKKFQFRGTPSFIIVKSDGTDIDVLTGAHPFPSFVAIIEDKLKDKQ